MCISSDKIITDKYKTCKSVQFIKHNSAFCGFKLKNKLDRAWQGEEQGRKLLKNKLTHLQIPVCKTVLSFFGEKNMPINYKAIRLT